MGILCQLRRGAALRRYFKLARVIHANKDLDGTLYHKEQKIAPLSTTAHILSR